MEQRRKVVRDIVLTCMELYNMLRSHQGGDDRPPTPADDIQPPRLPLREAKHQRDLLKDYFNNLGALAGQEDRI